MTDSRNEHVYQLVRANILASFKGAVYVDAPRFLVHRVDSFFCRHHSMKHFSFMDALKKVLSEMEKDFNLEMEDFNPLITNLQGLQEYLDMKINGDI